MTSLLTSGRLLFAGFAAILLISLSSCDLAGDGGQTYMTVHYDTAWTRSDMLEISWIDTASGAGGLLYKGKPEDLKEANKFVAEGYKGQKIKILFKGFIDNDLAYEEHRGFDGANPATVNKVIVPLGPGGGAARVKRPKLSPISADTLVTIRDPVSFRANATMDSGTLKSFAWDYDGDGVTDDSSSLSGASAIITGSHSFPTAGTFLSLLRAYSVSDSVSLSKVEVVVLKDEPTADAGGDRTVYPGDTLTLGGSGKDGLGRIVRMEWRVGTDAFVETPDGTLAVKVPGTAGDVIGTLRVTDDDALTAEDEVTIHVVSRTEANLTAIAVSAGNLSPQFNPAILAYADTVGYEKDAITVTPAGNGTITVNGETVESGKPSTAIALRVGINAVDLAVALAGKPGKSYQLKVVRLPASADAKLSRLIVSGGILDTAFSAEDTLYTVSAPNGISSTTITATLANPASNLVINGFKTASGAVSGAIPLAQGPNPILIVVTAQGGDIRTYRLNVVRAGNGNANLSGLTLSAGEINPAFAAGSIEYALGVGAEVIATSVIATSQNPAATLTVNGKVALSGSPFLVDLVIGANPILIEVTAQNGARLTYKVRVTRAGNKNADLSGLSLSAGGIVPGFTPEGVFYSLEVPNGTAATAVTAMVAKETSVITVNGQPAESGKAFSLDLSVGAFPITISVTSQSGDKKSYTAVVTRAKNPNADLSGLVLSTGALNPPFSPETGVYTCLVASESSSLMITPTTAGAASTIAMNGADVSSGTAFGPVPLSAGENVVEIVVTAQSGAFRKYSVKITRPLNGNTELSGLSISPGSLDSAFNPARTYYAATVANSVFSVTVTPTSLNPASVDSVNGMPVASGSPSGAIPLKVGNNPIIIAVTAENGAWKTYTIVVKREGSANADLASLSVSPGTLDKTFAPDNTQYAVSLPNTATAISVAATRADSVASVAFHPAPLVNLDAGLNTIKVEVTSQSGSKKTYILLVTRGKSNDADLANLVLSGGAIPLAFTKGTTAYPLSVDNTVSGLTVTPTVSSTGSTVMVKGTAIGSGSTSGKIDLTVGLNQIPVVVTAEDGTKKAYQVDVTRTNDNPILSGLKDTTISVNDPVSFKLTAADPQGIKQFLWDFNGDGTNENTTATGAITHVFPATPQTIHVIVTVQDNQGGSTKGTVVITVIQDAPKVSAGKDTIVAVGRQIRVTGSVEDVYGKTVSLEWSFGGGLFIKASKPDTVITAPSTPNPAYQILLRATDDDGNVVTATATAKVEKIDLVVVGDFGFIATSPDNGNTWVKRTSGIRETLYSVVWTGNLLVAVGSCILTSPDGITWTLRSARTLPQIQSVIWTGSQLVTVGYGGIIRTSPDGITWTVRNSAPAEYFTSVAWSGSKLVAVQSDHDSIYTSPDGISWTPHYDFGSAYLRNVTWTGTRAVAVGLFGMIHTSTDLQSWSEIPRGVGGPYPDLGSVVKTKNQLVAVGNSGSILTSPDGLTWTERNSGTNAWMWSVTGSGNQIVAVGIGGVVLISTDGISWTERNTGSSELPISVISLVP